MASSLARYILCFLFTFKLAGVYGQWGTSLMTSRQIASGSQDLILTAPEALYINPAGIAGGSERVSGLVNYSNRYGTEIHSASGALTWAHDGGALGFLVGSYGISGFRQAQLSMAYAKKLGSMSRLGMQLNYYNLSILDFGTRSSLDLSIGGQHAFSDKVATGVYILNPFAARRGDLPDGGIGMSINGMMNENLSAYTSIFRDWQGEWDIRPGLQYRIIDQLTVLWSMHTAHASMNYGVDLHLSDGWNTIISFQAHQLLGGSLSLSMAYILKYE